MSEDGRVKNPGVQVGDPRLDTVDLLELHRKNASGIVRAAFMDVDRIFAGQMGYSGSLFDLLAVPSSTSGVQLYSQQIGSHLPIELQEAILRGHILTYFTDENGATFCYELEDNSYPNPARDSFSAHFHTMRTDPIKEIKFANIRKRGKTYDFNVPSIEESSGGIFTEYYFFGENPSYVEQVLRLRKRGEAFDLTLDYEGIDEEGVTRLANGQQIELRERDALWRGTLWLGDGYVEWKNAPANSTGDVPQIRISEDGTRLIIQGVNPTGGFARPIKIVGYDYENELEADGPVASFPVSGNIYDFLRQALSLVPDSVQIDSASPKQRHLHS